MQTNTLNMPKPEHARTLFSLVLLLAAALFLLSACAHGLTRA
jgi:hypothetical protein